jgi:hypothetical protein
MVLIILIIRVNLLEQAKCGASRSGYTTCSNAVLNVPRKETIGQLISWSRLQLVGLAGLAGVAKPAKPAYN